jgi:hypothetical protein
MFSVFVSGDGSGVGSGVGSGDGSGVGVGSGVGADVVHPLIMGMDIISAAKETPTINGFKYAFFFINNLPMILYERPVS